MRGAAVRFARAALAAAALVALLASCGLSDALPAIEVYAGADATGTLVAPGHVLVVPDPDAASVTIHVLATSGSPINSLHCTVGGVDVAAVSRSGGLLAWGRTYDIPLHDDIVQVRLYALDSRLKEAARVVQVLREPDAIESVTLGGRDAGAIHSVWAGDPLRLVVTLARDLDASYLVTVSAERWDGASWAPAVSAAPLTDALVFPDAPGRYRFTVRAEDPATGVYEEVPLVVYVHAVTVTASWGGAPGSHAHAATGRSLELAWGDLDTAVGAGLWSVEVAADTTSHFSPFAAGTGASLPFDDTGDYRVRVGAKADASADLFYSASRSLGYTGTNTAPSTPVSSDATPTIGATAGGTFAFDVSSVDPELDEVTFELINVSLSGGFGRLYDPIARLYSFTYRGSSGTFGDTDPSDEAWELTWSVPAGTFVLDPPNQPGTFVLRFVAADRFLASSEGLELLFTVTP